MRFLLDMGLAHRPAAWLREHGHDAVHLIDILAWARQEQRLVVTCDRDFGQLLAAQREATPSVILFRLSRYRTDDVQLRLTTLLEQHADKLAHGCILSVGDRLTRIRMLPL